MDAGRLEIYEEERPPVNGRSGLVLVLGDQLSHASPALQGLGSNDRVLMIEAPGEAGHVWSHKARIVLFLSAMRHFRDELRARGIAVDYIALEDSSAAGLAERLTEALKRRRPDLIRALEPGEWRLQRDIAAVAVAAGVPLHWLDDPHFLCSRADFVRWADDQRGQLRMEFFYRSMRREHAVLLDADGKPEGGRWNYDTENRKGFPKAGPGPIPPHQAFAPDALTRQAMAEVEQRFGDHPGSLASFAWPVDRGQALQALQTFVDTRLCNFGDFQDAMWQGEPFGWHALLSSSLNLHLLDPREVVAAAEAAWRNGRAPLAGVEGFIRQILGWREFMRGMYWLDMPGMTDANHYRHRRPLPGWYWTGKTEMACLRDVIDATLANAYAHHIQRLMVTGLFALLAEIDPKQVADWYLAVYVDAVEWAELPNVAGMALYADGGRFTSKPYIASGAYIQRMSNYCDACRYAPDAKAAARSGKPLCPFTVLYWHFLDRHHDELAANPRTVVMVKNLMRRSDDERLRTRQAATSLLQSLETL